MSNGNDNHKDARPNHIEGIGHFIISGKNSHMSVMLKDCSWIAIRACTKSELLNVVGLRTFNSRDTAAEAIQKFKSDCKAQKGSYHNGTKRRSQHRQPYNGY